MNLHIERVVPFPRDAVYAWWRDFREDDHAHPESPARSRRGILRREGDEVWLRDRTTRPEHVNVEERVILDPPKGYSVEARYPGADVRYAYRFAPDGEGSRIILQAEIRPRDVGRAVLPFLRRWASRFAERDTDFHVRRMMRDLTSRATGPERCR